MGASGLPPLPLNYWWTEESEVLAGIQNQLQNKDMHTEYWETTIKSSGLKNVFCFIPEISKHIPPPLSLQNLIADSRAG